MVTKAVLRLLFLVGCTLGDDNSEYCSSTICTKDLIPHCMSDGSIVRGCEELKYAVCNESLTEDSGWNSSLNCLPEGYCDDTSMCTFDLLPHCLTNGTVVSGCDDLKRALCADRTLKEVEDWDFYDSCLPEGFCESTDTCTLDNNPHCLKNGTIVSGCAELQRAVCDEDALRDPLWVSCFK